MYNQLSIEDLDNVVVTVKIKCKAHISSDHPCPFCNGRGETEEQYKILDLFKLILSMYVDKDALTVATIHDIEHIWEWE